MRIHFLIVFVALSFASHAVEFALVVEQTLAVGARHNLPSPDTNAPSVALLQEADHLLLVVTNIYNGKLERQKGVRFWNSFSADAVVKQYRDAGFALLPHERNGLWTIRREELPLTIYLFGEGFLQVTDINSGPSPQAKIRYKLVDHKVTR